MADRTVKVTLLAAANSYIADMNKAAQATKKTGTEAEQAAARHREQSEAMREVGGAITAMGAIALVGVGIAVAKFAEFDQAISNVKAATQESAENMALLREAALDAGADTVFSATEAANAIEELGKAGLSTEQILNGGLNGALSLAAAGQLSVADAAQIAAIAVKQFNLEGSDVPHVADLLAAGAGKAVGDVKDLSDALGQAGLVANGAGQSIEDTTGVLAAFADAGLLGSDAGTSLKSAIIALQAPTQKSRDVMEQYGLSFYDANGQMLSFDQIAGQLETKLNGLTDEQRNAALATIFGNDALRSANVLYNQGAQGIQKYIDQTNDSGYAAKVAADRLNNLSGDVEKLGGALDTALIRSGSGLNDSLRALTQGATGVVDAFGSLPEPVLGGAAALTALVGVVGVVGGAALIAIPKIAQFKLALSTLNISGASAARGIGLATGALAAAGIAFSIWAARQAEATANAADFKASLDEATGATTNYTRELVAQKLAQAGVFETGREVGLSQRELTDAVVEGGEKLAAVQQKLTENNTLATAFTGLAFRAGNAQTALRDLSGDLERGEQDLFDQAAAAEGSATSTQGAAEAYQDAASKVNELQSNLDGLIQTINNSNQVGSDAITSNIAYQDSLAKVDETIKNAREGQEGYALTLDQSTQAGRDNMGMLVGLAENARDAAEKQLSLDNNTDNYRATLDASRQALIQRAQDLGYNESRAGALADQILRIPSATEWEAIVRTAAANSEINRFIQDASRRIITIGVTTYSKDGPQGALRISTPGSPDKFADGGYVRGPGGPRTDSILARLSNGEFVANAEATGKNRRALEYINRGGVIPGFASGGYVAPRYASGGPVINVSAPAAAQFPSQLTLMVDGQQMTAYVKSAAVDVVRDASAGRLR